MQRMVWTVTYKLPNTPNTKGEIKKYTAASAAFLANSIEELGGIALISEGSEEMPEEINDDLVTVQSETGTKLVW
jgi:hypothetical protein